MSDIAHTDAIGQLINVGDYVASPDGTSLHIRIVKKINPKMITVKNTKNNRTELRYPANLLVVKDNKYLTAYLLKI